MGAAESIVTDILIFAGRLVVVERVDDGLGIGYTSPDGGIYTRNFGTCGQAIFETLTTVAENVFADVAKIDVKFTS